MSLRPLLLACLLIVLTGMSCRHTPSPAPVSTDAERQPFSAAPAFPGWMDACGRGEAEPCGALLSSIFFSGRTELLAEAQQAFTRACDAGVPDGCTGAILSRLSDEEPVLDAEGLNRACTQGSRFACLMQLPMEYQATPDPEALAALIERHASQCEAEGGVRCSVVSSAFDTGTGVEADPSRARTLAWKGCEEGDPTSCYQLALLLEASAHRDREQGPEAPLGAAEEGASSHEDPAATSTPSAAASGPEGPEASATTAPDVTAPGAEADAETAAERPTPRDPQLDPSHREPEAAEARRAFQRACEGRVGPACLKAAQLLFSDVGGKPDPDTARLRAWQACELGERDACDLLALTDEGRIYPPRPESTGTSDPGRTRQLQEKYCGLGGPRACTALGLALAEEARDTQRLEGMDAALGWLVKGCAMEGEQACQLLFSIASGSIQACDQDSRPDRCLVAGFLHARATELPPGLTEAVRADPSRAAEAFTRACEGGQRAACARLEKAAGSRD